MKRVSFLLASLFLLVSCELSTPPKGSIHHVGIALSYHHTGVQPLYAPQNDLLCLSKALDAWYWPQRVTHTHLSDMPHTINTTLATKEAVVSAIARCAESLRKEDLLFITYSGHGLRDGSWVLASASDTPLIYTEEYGVDPAVLFSVDELFDLLQETEATTLIIADCCYSGALLGSKQPSGGIAAAYRQYFAESTYIPEIFVLTSTTEDHTCSEPLTGVHTHGYFTEALLKALGWDCRKKVLTKHDTITGIDALYQSIKKNQRIPTRPGISYTYQCPQLSGGPLELIISR